ncbi:methyltransferase [Austwickia sp. TVS 96-490-7B]|uniref:DUF7059 domain-containing protein n=1 Tax=Austwickia sp. TVS 96-490-7B TaxID=2830843 RepID=UPI001C55A7D3|nr:methyltransferase [Austwickia sp. TVS 96-490-7B]
MITTDVPQRDLALIDRLRDDLTELDMTVDGVHSLLGAQAAAALHHELTMPARRRLAGDDSPLGTAVALFTLGAELPVAQVAAAFPRTGGEGLARLGLVLPGVEGAPGARLRAACDLRPYGDETHHWWVTSDLGEMATGGPLAPDHVLGIGGASATLASWTPRPTVARALDLGTGCGVQALHLHGHCGEVVATDISRRALAFAAFNAALAGQQWDLRAGSLFEPVAQETFDLVVSNPPFVITPRQPGVPRYDYRDGGLTGDRIVADLVGQVGDRLRPGGIAHLLGNWEVRAGQSGREVWDEWLDGTGLDACVVQRDTQEPWEYARTWIRDGGLQPGSAAHDDLMGAWIDDFAQRQVQEIGFGVITLHRPDSADGQVRAPFIEVVEHTGPVASPMGPTVWAALQARIWLAEHGVSGVLERAWQVADDVTEERFGRPGAPDPAVIRIRQGGGLGAAVQVDTVVAAFVGVCDGELTAGQALGAIAALVERPVAQVIAEAWPTIHQLIADGFLRPA